MCILRQVDAAGSCPSAKTYLDLSACVTIGHSSAGFLFVCTDLSTCLSVFVAVVTLVFCSYCMWRPEKCSESL